jgi:hypothetical protein
MQFDPGEPIKIGWCPIPIPTGIYDCWGRATPSERERGRIEPHSAKETIIASVTLKTTCECEAEVGISIHRKGCIVLKLCNGKFSGGFWAVRTQPQFVRFGPQHLFGRRFLVREQFDGYPPASPTKGEMVCAIIRYSSISCLLESLCPDAISSLM